MRLLLIASLLLSAALAGRGDTVPLNQRVLVVYNANSSVSREVAEYYIAKRDIPAGNTCKIKVDSTDSLNPDDFDSQVKRPIRKCLDEVGKEKVLYIVFSYQTPFLIVLNGRNYALDAFVADIWDEYLPSRPAAEGDVQPYFGNAQSEGNLYQPFVPFSTYRDSPGARHIYSVCRIDAATPALAKGLVDKALWAEAHGLSGKSCFDLNAPAAAQPDYQYGAGNWDIYRAEQFAREAGFPIMEDTHDQEFGTAPAPLRCDDAALYAGWYSLNHYNDAFTWNRGAIGIHLDSASALNPRSGPNWAANAIQKGITATSGAVGEPYLENLPHPDQAFLYLFRGANVGDALLRSTRLLKWMIINIGDPLYRPFPNGTRLSASGSGLLVFGLLPPVMVGNGTSTGLIALNTPALTSGVNFSLTASPANLVDLPPSVLIPAGTNYVKFAVHARTVHEDGVITRIFVKTKDIGTSNTLVLFPLLGPLEITPARVRGRSAAVGVVVLRRPAPSPGVNVALSTSNPPIAAVPSNITVPEGQNRATFQILTRGVVAENVVSITASYEGVNRAATLTVVP